MAHRPIVEWARANGIPDDFADDAEITVNKAAGVIMVEMFARDPDAMCSSTAPRS